MHRSVAAAVLTALLLSAWSMAQPASAPPTATAASAPDGAKGPDMLAIEGRQAADDGVQVVRLSNGMTVILQSVRIAPVVCARAYVRAGSMYEGPWLGCGISHLCEHLVAQGAEHEGDKPGEPKGTDRVSLIGGQANAYTYMDQTCYYISAAAGRAGDCVDLLADWLVRPAISEQDFQREHGVVQRELEMGMDSPGRQMSKSHMAGAFGTHPAAVPIIGFLPPLRKLAYGDVQAYIARMYVPQNVVVSIVGDIDVEAILTRLRQAFAGFGEGRLPDLSLPPVEPWTGARRIAQTFPTATEAMEELSFQSIPLAHEDLYTLDVLSNILAEGESSRLERLIRREKQLVTSISSSSWTPAWGRGLFSISFRADPAKADAAETAIVEELRRVVAEGVTPDELARAKRQKVSEFINAQQTVDSQAASLASDYLATGDVGFSRTYTQRIQAVTADQVRQAAARYFAFDRMVVTRLVPGAKAEAATRPHAVAEAEEVFALPNGLRVILHSTGAPGQGGPAGIVAMTFVTPGGLLLEDAKTNGLGCAMASLSTQGAGERSADEIAAFFDQAGGYITGVCGNSTIYWQASALDDSLAGAMDIFADVIQRPTFTKEELDRLRPILLAAIAKVDEQPLPQAQKLFRAEFFRGSPYGMLPSGSREVVQAATVGQLREHHRKALKAGSSVLAVFGRFDLAAARKQVERLFADLPPGKAALVLPPSRTVAPAGELVLRPSAHKVAAVMVAAPGITVGDLADRLPLDVLDTIMSGYQLPSGWLHEELRGKQLVYVVHAINWMGLAPGAFQTYALCQPDKAPLVAQIIADNYRRGADFTPTQEQVDQAVNTIVTAEALDNQSMPELSLASALDELYGLGHDFHRRLAERYGKVTPRDVATVARKILAGGYVTVVLTPQGDAFQAATRPADATLRSTRADERKKETPDGK